MEESRPALGFRGVMRHSWALIQAVAIPPRTCTLVLQGIVAESGVRLLSLLDSPEVITSLLLRVTDEYRTHEVSWTQWC